MPTKIPYPLVYWIARVTEKPVADALHYLKTENEVLREQIKGPIRTTPSQRQRLRDAAKPLGNAIKNIITIVCYTTFLRWGREVNRRGQARLAKVGRPETREDIQALIVRIARENDWGYTRIAGELKKLGYGEVSRSTIKNILLAHGLEPGPRRGKGSWAEFLKRHKDTLWACDFVSKRIITQSGLLECFVLFFVNVGSRRVYLAGVTVDPNAAWLAQQARNVGMYFEDQPYRPNILLHDLDGKFTPHFDEILKWKGIRVVRLPARAPNLNAFAERWVRSFRQECLNHFIVLGEGHMRHIAQTYVDFYNEHRPHQSLGNLPLGQPADRSPPTPVAADRVKCREWLGGLLRHYYRDAA